MIYVGADHRGIEIKNEIMAFLKSKNYEVEDIYPSNEEMIDYPKVAFKLGEKVVEYEGNLGILFCGTGIGMSIASNKVHNVRCAKVHSKEEARLSREHNDANVLALSSSISLEEVQDIVLTFIETEFSPEERYQKRKNQILNYEKREYNGL